MILYRRTIAELVKDGVLKTDEKILVLAAGALDRDVFLESNFSDVVISNIDHHGGVTDYAPYEWCFQDAEAVDYGDESFDWVFIHAGLHHCASPHKALCEMLRVSRKGIVAFEARHSVFMRSAVWLGMTGDFELEPVALSGGVSGGIRATNIPNYIYRWTEIEVEKTVNSYIPKYRHKFLYFYQLRLPSQRLGMSRNPLKRFVGHGFRIVAPLFEALFPRQCNLFGFAVIKNMDLQPWLVEENGVVSPNMSYLAKKMDTAKYN